MESWMLCWVGEGAGLGLPGLPGVEEVLDQGHLWTTRSIWSPWRQRRLKCTQKRQVTELAVAVEHCYLWWQRPLPWAWTLTTVWLPNLDVVTSTVSAGWFHNSSESFPTGNICLSELGLHQLSLHISWQIKGFWINMLINSLCSLTKKKKKKKNSGKLGSHG